MTHEKAQYIADYIKEEQERGHDIDSQTILDAIAAYEGGAR